ncbi:hypothetical protein J3E64_001839 [Sphingobium sp. OAS761]|uniref:hypothetical protein n=1 Tax=Sphingobium sp. OAS761 TaxID=2817901 RepID=UPI00209EF09B|nr:hypothetical protein [Sphingobium sp. OAS761]MCP1470152.1 hypothetical protein [Sphingobium sp. OAS761]
MAASPRHSSDPAETYLAPFFDMWFQPFAFWANWWSFCAQSLHVARKTPPRTGPENEAPVDVEVEEGLVA